ncbi:Tubulin-tyrosine ligase family protein [Dictyocaulus viviparus]|uniref:Tubulin-tyrosine ligase family protein n=1 Tax=Dictyocaulus viviparus TaxID=29172 RepID=A0A0D8X8Y2_DICVI|nr:Tubulin-tyrosine ligase family protein [Dictyocaulus viviparus]
MTILPKLNQKTYSQRRRSTLFCIDTSHSHTNQPVVSLCAKMLGFIEYPFGRDDDEPCDVYWHSTVNSSINTIVKSSRSSVNKLPGMTELSKKISLTHAISSMEKLFPEAYTFYPRSFFLPSDYNDLIAFWKSASVRRKEQGQDKELYFIVKPDDGAQGFGIYLINDPSQIKDPTKKQLVQEYVSDPFLMKDQLKFDFRVYGVIKSLNPLSLYVSREGMARFCTVKYQKPTSTNLNNLFSHLTNYSLNKASDSYVHSNSLQDQVTGSKRLLSTVFYQMSVCGLRTKKLWHEVKLIIVKTILAMVPELMIHYEHHFSGKPAPRCFQIIGFDIMVRENGSPVLLEVNACPSLTIGHSPGGDNLQKSIVDEVIKIPLVRDTLLLITDQLPDATKPVSSAASGSSRSTDDLRALKAGKKPHLSEVFPNRYGDEAVELLFLDQVVYIFMQYANLRLSTTISFSSLRRFIKDCGVESLFTSNEIEKKVQEISYHFVCDTNYDKGLPFQGFLNFMIFLANRKFANEPNLLNRLRNLIKICGNALRKKGVRSQCLRHEEVDMKSKGVRRIYMLPNRLSTHRSKSCEPIKISPQKIGRKPDRNNNMSNIVLPPILRK